MPKNELEKATIYETGFNQIHPESSEDLPEKRDTVEWVILGIKEEIAKLEALVKKRIYVPKEDLKRIKAEDEELKILKLALFILSNDVMLYQYIHKGYEENQTLTKAEIIEQIKNMPAGRMEVIIKGYYTKYFQDLKDTGKETKITELKPINMEGGIVKECATEDFKKAAARLEIILREVRDATKLEDEDFYKRIRRKKKK